MFLLAHRLYHNLILIYISCIYPEQFHLNFYHPLKSNPFLMHTKYGNNQNLPVFLKYNMPYAYLNTIEECAKDYQTPST